MSDSTALIPIHLDSLFIPSGSSMEVAAPAVDFTRLDDPTQPYLGSSLTTEPLSTVQLEPGVHLHWALPDALTKTMSRSIIRKHAFQIAFGNVDGNAIWEVMLIAKWLQATSKDTAKVLPKENRGAVGIPPERLAIVNRLLDDSAFPAVPNRWQITRFSGNGNPEKQWMVESDYVWPDKNPPQKDRYTSYPKAGSAGLDYCFIGRWYELNSQPPSGAYLPYPLTAVGYGEPTFAALYPNCRSVFGFCDTERQTLNAPCTYSIRGFYSDPALDHYAVFVADFLKNPPDEYPYLNLLSALKDEFQWFFPIGVKKGDFDPQQLALMNARGWLDPALAPASHTGSTLGMTSKSDDFILSAAASDPGNTLGAGNEVAEKAIRAKLETLIQQQLPAQTVCFAWCTVRPGSANQPAAKDVALAMGTTGSEAMSAFLANKISPSQKALVEDYLEAHQLSARLEHQQIDLGPKFEEARHEKGFIAVPGGTIWALRPQSTDTQQADAQAAAGAVQAIALPDGLALTLNELNVLQQQLDQTNFQIESLQRQIFADWCQYLTEESNLKNVVSPGSFSNQYDAGFANQYTSGFTDEDHDTVDTRPAETLDNMRAYIDWQIDVALKQLQQDAAELPQKLKAKRQQLTAGLASLQPKQNYIVQPTAAPRYWQPAEPTLLVAGLKPSPRHGQDGRLRDDQLLGCLIGKDAKPEDFALYSPNNDWHPVLMDWAVSFTQAKNNYTGDPDDYGYIPSYLEDNYTLRTADFPPAPNTFSPRTAIPFSGRSILTPSGSLLQKQAIIRNLIPNILEKIPQNAAQNKEEFKKWVKSIDPVLSASAGQAGYDPGSDQTVIRQWISARLADTPDGKLPGLVTWYWTQVVIDKKDDADAFVRWASERMQLKTVYYKKYNIPAANQDDFYLQNDKGFIPWLKTELGAAWSSFFADRNITDAAAQTAYAAQNFNALLNWYQAQVRDNLHTVMDYHAYRNIAGVHGLSQALSGFNKALVTLSQSYQLNIAHPRATDGPSKAFAAKVRDAVQGQNRYSPLPDGDFSPIRAGKMSIDRVHLINNFGQYWPALGDNLAKSAPLVCANAMTLTPGTGEIALTPRLAEPARLNFRWLSSAHNDLPDIAQDKDLVEMNSHPAANPICGWLLPNNLDDSLMVYSQKGQAYGYIEQGGNWRVFPGHDGPVLPQEIEHPHLRNMVQRLCQTGKTQPGFIPDFIAVLDTALDSIAPDNSDQHDALALLMGRPIALVRAAISLEHQGGDPINQSQHIFLDDLGHFADALKAGAAATFERNTFGVDQVKIPLRLGEFRQRNDGLLGYWIDRAPAGALPAGTQPGDTFFAPQSFDPQKNKRPGHILTHDADGVAFQIDLTLADTDRLELSMLVDPRGKVHATCGLLPAKAIHLPPDQYKAALNNIEIAFLSAPILTLPERLQLSVPREPGYGWSWIAREDTHWKIVNSVGALQPADVERAFPEVASVVWDLLITSGWIEETTDGNARVVPKDQRPAPGLDDKYAAILPKIEDMLERTRINPFDATAAFSGTPEIREGWLKLTKTK